jgi:hypothetical protein
MANIRLPLFVLEQYSPRRGLSSSIKFTTLRNGQNSTTSTLIYEVIFTTQWNCQNSSTFARTVRYTEAIFTTPRTGRSYEVIFITLLNGQNSHTTFIRTGAIRTMSNCADNISTMPELVFQQYLLKGYPRRYCTI